MTWDEIPKADYKTWTSSASESAVVNSANNDVNQSSTFEKLKTNVQWLEKNNDKEYSLNITKYKQEQKELNDVYKQIETLYKLPKPMAINNLTSDTTSINTDKDKIDKNKQWLKVRSDDIYIDESVKVLNKIITQNNVAKTN